MMRYLRWRPLLRSVLALVLLALTALTGAKLLQLHALRQAIAGQALAVEWRWFGNPHDALVLDRAGLLPDDSACSHPDQASLWPVFGRYTDEGDDIAATACAARRDITALPAAEGDGRIQISLFAGTYGYAASESWRTLLTTAFVLRGTPAQRDAVAAALRTRCALLPARAGDQRIAGLCGQTELARAGLLAQTRLQPWLAGTGDSVLLHRVNTSFRRELILPVAPRIEMDVLSTPGGVQLNHPPMRPSGLLLRDHLAGVGARFVWLDWKNPQPGNMAASLAEFDAVLGATPHLVEIPFEYFATGGLPAGGKGHFSVYLPTKDWQRCGDDCDAMGKAVNALLARYPQLDCSFDSDLLPQVERWTRCGSNHGTYTWYLEPLVSDTAYDAMLVRWQQIRAYAGKRPGKELRVILKLQTRYY